MNASTCNALIHLYRGELSRLITYRTRLDQTTNWCLTSVIGLTIFSLNAPQLSHLFHLLIAGLGFFFWFVESRRWRLFAAIQCRVRLLETGFYGDVLNDHFRATHAGDPFDELVPGEKSPDNKGVETKQEVEVSAEVAPKTRAHWTLLLQDSLHEPHLTISRKEALFIRFRRVYMILFALILAGWSLKVVLHHADVSFVGPVVLWASFLSVSAACHCAKRRTNHDVVL